MGASAVRDVVSFGRPVTRDSGRGPPPGDGATRRDEGSDRDPESAGLGEGNRSSWSSLPHRAGPAPTRGRGDSWSWTTQMEAKGFGNW